MFLQFKSFEALQIVKSSIVLLCILFKSIFRDSKVSHLAKTQGCPIAFAQVPRIFQLYQKILALFLEELLLYDKKGLVISKKIWSITEKKQQQTSVKDRNQ